MRAMASSSKSLSFELVEIENPKELNFILGHGEQLIPAAQTLVELLSLGVPVCCWLAQLAQHIGSVSGLLPLPASPSPSPSLCVPAHSHLTPDTNNTQLTPSRQLQPLSTQHILLLSHVFSPRHLSARFSPTP